MKRWLLIGGGAVAALVVIIVVAVVFLVSSLDSLIQAAVEKYGSVATQAKVTLSEVEISPSSGQGVLRRLVVGNPQGFETDSAFELGEVSVTLDVGTITEDTVVIKEIVVAGPQITYELGSGGSNLDALQRNVDSYVKKMGGGGSETAGEAGKTEDGGGPKLVIENLYVRGGKVSVSATLLQGKKMTVSLPEIHLSDIGKEKEGASPGEVIKEVLASIQTGVVQSASQLDLGGALGSAGEAASKAATEAGGAIMEGAGEAGGKIKKLFGK